MADDASSELTEAQQAKLAAKQFKAESRKLAKALKGKKPEPKLRPSAACREDAAFLAKGDCLVPLLQQCVFKKTKKGATMLMSCKLRCPALGPSSRPRLSRSLMKRRAARP